MIRTVPIPQSVRRLGVVQAGAGGSASSYQFDPASGLSSDPALAYYLQDLTPAQLQAALNGSDPSQSLITQLQEEQAGTGQFSLPCGTPANDPNCDGNTTGPFAPKGFSLGSLGTVPTWLWIAGGGILAFSLVKR